MPNIQEEPDCFVVVCEGDPKIVGSTETLEEAQDWVGELRNEDSGRHYRVIRATWDLVRHASDWGWTTLWVIEEGREIEWAVVGQPLCLAVESPGPDREKSDVARLTRPRSDASSQFEHYAVPASAYKSHRRHGCLKRARDAHVARPERQSIATYSVGATFISQKHLGPGDGRPS